MTTLQRCDNEGDTVMAMMKLRPMRRRHRNGDNETVTMTLRQCDDEGNTMTTMKP